MTTTFRRRLTATLAAAGATLGVVTGSLALGAHAAAASTVRPPSGHPASQVPWGRVGSGWQLAAWAPAVDAAQRLYLIDPAGVRYRVGAAGHDYLLDWSPDGRRVLLRDQRGVSQLDLRTGRRTRLASLDATESIGYSANNSGAILATADIVGRDGSVTGRLRRYSGTGRLLHGYPTAVAGAGQLNTYESTEADSGREVVMSGRHGLVVLTPGGAVVRRVGTALKDCDLSGTEWVRGSVLASCNGGAVWAVPVSGARPTKITRTTSAHSPFGNSTAWRYSGGRLGLARVGCGPQLLVRFDRQGRSTPVRVALPRGRAGAPVYAGHHGDIVDLTVTAHSTCMQGTSTLFAFDVARGTSRVLLGAPLTGGTVADVLPFPTDR